MSRTKRGEKGCGYDYWSRRPYSSSYGYGPDIKKLCHRAERIQAKEIVNREVEEMLEPDRHGFIGDCNCWECDQADYDGVEGFTIWLNTASSEELDKYYAMLGELNLD